MTVWPSQQMIQATLYHPGTYMWYQEMLQHPGHHWNCISCLSSCLALTSWISCHAWYVCHLTSSFCCDAWIWFCLGAGCTVTIVFRLITSTACPSKLKCCITHTIMAWLRCILHGLHRPTWPHMHAWLHMIRVHLGMLHPLHA